MITTIIGACVALLALFTILILAGDILARFFTKPDSIVGANLNIDWEDDDIRGECPQCRDQDASIDSNGDAMCIECGLGCDW